ncbi:MAG: hypothetical protein NTZ49_02570 [Candidatus Parcubacteria bacterium]|nr:hypothetical protein [Candidatus Parcubacteria bacterium]
MEENKILQKLEQQDQKFDKMFAKLVEHDEKLDNMMTKDDGRQIMDTLEPIASTVQRLDQERLSTISRIDRIEDEVGIHGAEINKIKVQLNIP